MTSQVPHNADIEKAVLGAVLMGGKLGAASDLTPDDFYLGDHRTIFKACLELHDEGAPIDLVSVGSRCNGNAAYVAQMASEAVTAANLAYHVGKLRELSFKRLLSNKCKYIIEGMENLSPSEISTYIAEMAEIAEVTDFKRESHREINLTREIKLYIEATDGDFTATDCYKLLQDAARATKGDNFLINRRSVKDILRRLSDNSKGKALIRKAGDRDGVYRRIDDQPDVIDWWSASDKPLDIYFPLSIESYAKIYPKNIIVIAGEPNSGKTAFMLNAAFLNKDNFDVHYFSSEMGPTELRTRLTKFDGSLSAWKKIQFKERAGNFSDVLEPDALTFIDFLEVNDDFYKIGAFIREIYDKLDNGVCFIGIQKNRGRDTGRGGEMGLEKPRLYLSMEPGKIKIIKAKAWAKEGINPNGLQREFKLVQGAKFIETSPWHREGENWK